MAERILIVEDEPEVRAGLRTVLETEGYVVDEASDGRSGLELALERGPSLLLLDLNIPELDGFGVCRELRKRGATTPVLLLTARTDEIDKVLGFELGADDYVTKPFGVRELIARIRALIRRSIAPTDPQAEDTLCFGEVTVDLRRLSVARGEESFELYHYEAEILRHLVAHEGKAVSRSQLLDAVWGEDSFPTTRTVDFHVCNLRKKVEQDTSRPVHLQTVHGVGYRFVR